MARFVSGLLLLVSIQSSYSAFVREQQDVSGYATVALDNGTFVGISEGSVSIFRGIPYARPPIGDLRLRLPVASDPYISTYNATAFGASCIQQVNSDKNMTGLNPAAVQVLDGVLDGSNFINNDDEDCLTINVYTPANATKDSRLPVVYWIYGGGFENGETAMYNGSVIVERALQLDHPVVYVSVNYRLSALGFLGGIEAQQAGVGNLGLQDQRLGLRWVQKYISAFGGDPTKVIIWGESAGAFSVALQMVTNNGDNEGLFRGAFMQSGSPSWFGPNTMQGGQASFNQLANVTGCGSLLGNVTVFNCLRNVSTADFRSAIQASSSIFDYASLNLAWMPRIDGLFLTDSPHQLVLDGSVANVPFITGDCDDEGTLFSLSNSNITTENELRQYLPQFFPFSVNSSDLDAILSAYPEDPTLGSPFGTGTKNAITPQFKRLAAILGDLVFQAPRRAFLSERSANTTAFAFLSKKLKSTPILGASHNTDLQDIFGPGELTDALVNFATNLDPNGPTLIDWPAYTIDAPTMLAVSNGNVTQELVNDTFRAEGMQVLMQVALNNSVS
ncbi:carotenoid ester lipase precursor [Peniophora sp. CONT]|nr:carotenoid ester lipase precursor [Peniophora sp. CONT]